MSDGGDDADGITRIVNAVRRGDATAGDQIMSTIYAQLRQIAGAKMAGERSDETIQATALVHDAWLRLGASAFESRAHFFGAASEAMRRILVDRARRRKCAKHGGGKEDLDLDGVEIAAPMDGDELLAVHEALDQLAAHDSRKAELVKLRYFVGLSFEESASLLGVSVPTTKRDWAYARAWLHRAIIDGQAPGPGVDADPRPSA
jgi:RNA polymerase sigma factor (TIGR02999 family)